MSNERSLIVPITQEHTGVQDATAAAYVAKAKRQYTRLNDIEIDDEPNVSLSELGAWVAAWVWVGKEEAGLCKEIQRRTSKTKRMPATSQA